MQSFDTYLLLLSSGAGGHSGDGISGWGAKAELRIEAIERAAGN